MTTLSRFIFSLSLLILCCIESNAEKNIKLETNNLVVTDDSVSILISKYITSLKKDQKNLKHNDLFMGIDSLDSCMTMLIEYYPEIGDEINLKKYGVIKLDGFDIIVISRFDQIFFLKKNGKTTVQIKVFEGLPSIEGESNCMSTIDICINAERTKYLCQYYLNQKQVH